MSQPSGQGKRRGQGRPVFFVADYSIFIARMGNHDSPLLGLLVGTLGIEPRR